MLFYKKYQPLLELSNSKYYSIALTGGRGSLKTGHAIRGILRACLDRRVTVCCFRETKESIRESLKAEMDDILISDFKNRGFVSNSESIGHVGGSHIFFKGLREVNRQAVENLKGIASGTDIFLVDEAQTVSKSVWDVLIPTLRKIGSVLIVIYNRTDDNLPVEEALYIDYENKTAPDKTFFMELNYPEIEHLGLLSEQFLYNAELKRKNKPEEYRQFYLNIPPDKSRAAVVKYFSRENIVRGIKYADNIPLNWSLDFNVDPAMSVVFYRDKETQKYYVFDEIVMENCATQDAVNEFLARYGEHKASIVINGDASGDYRKTQSKYTDYAIIVNGLRKAGLEVVIEVPRRNPSVSDRISVFNNCVFGDGGQRRLFVDERCKWLLYNMKHLKYKEGTSQIDTPSHQTIENNKDDKFLGHIFDAASYAVYYYDKFAIE
jgi:PBSX family phage terminase large subunit